MSKKIRVTMPDDTVWDIPATVIAERRARYFAETDPDTTYDDELAYTLGDDGELLDWASNSTNWHNVAHSAVRVELVADLPEYERWWVNAHKEIVEGDR